MLPVQYRRVRLHGQAEVPVPARVRCLLRTRGADDDVHAPQGGARLRAGAGGRELVRPCHRGDEDGGGAAERSPRNGTA